MLTIKITTENKIKRKYGIQRLQKLRKHVVEKEGDLFFATHSCLKTLYFKKLMNKLKKRHQNTYQNHKSNLFRD